MRVSSEARRKLWQNTVIEALVITGFVLDGAFYEATAHWPVTFAVLAGCVHGCIKVDYLLMRAQSATVNPDRAVRDGRAFPPFWYRTASHAGAFASVLVAALHGYHGFAVFKLLVMGCEGISNVMTDREVYKTRPRGGLLERVEYQVEKGPL